MTAGLCVSPRQTSSRWNATCGRLHTRQTLKTTCPSALIHRPEMTCLSASPSLSPKINPIYSPTVSDGQLWTMDKVGHTKTQQTNKQQKKWVHAEEQETEEDVKKGKGGVRKSRRARWGEGHWQETVIWSVCLGDGSVHSCCYCWESIWQEDNWLPMVAIVSQTKSCLCVQARVHLISSVVCVCWRFSACAYLGHHC